jgi:iron complex outermembrane receptor protein
MFLMRRRVHAIKLLGPSLLVAPGVASGQAQVPVTEQAEAPAQTDAGEIVVTARKRAENLRDVPVSVTALGSDQITQARISQVADLGARIPNLSVSSASNLPYTLIRGFGSGSNASFEQSVGKFVDNVSYGRDQDLRLPLFDVERVEVLRGPQVLLYGNSTTAGALNITTKKPGDTLSADASVAYNFSYKEVTSQAGLTVPIAENISLRVSGQYQNRDKGLVYNSFTGADEPSLRNYAVRAILRAKPTDTLTLTLKAEYDRVQEEGNSGELSSQPVFGILPPFADAKLDSRKAENANRAPFFQPEFTGLENVTYQGDIAWDVGGGQLSSTTAYRKEGFAQALSVPTPINLLSAFVEYDYEQLSQELRYARSFGSLELTAGGYYQHDTYDIQTAIGFNLSPTVPGNPPIPPFAVNARLNQTQNSYSGFADFTYHLTDKFSIEAGGRYTWISKDADQFNIPGQIVLGKTFDNRHTALSPFPAFESLFVQGQGVASHSFTGLKYRDQFFQPQVVLQYKPSSISQIFAKYVKGTKAGGFDYFYTGFAPVGAIRDDVKFGAEDAASFELGTKGLMFSRALDYSLVLFRTTFTGLQASQFSGVNFVVTNVGKARSQGVELDLNYRPFSGLKLGASGAYLDAKYVDFPGQPCTIAQQIARGSPAGCSQDLSGTPTLLSSKWTGTFSADYTWSLTSDLNMNAGLTVLARSKYNASANHDSIQTQQGLAKLDGRIEIRSEDGHYTFALFGKNLTNKKTLEYGLATALTGGATTGFLSAGRELGLRFGFNY